MQQHFLFIYNFQQMHLSTTSLLTYMFLITMLLKQVMMMTGELHIRG